jgi:Ca2+-binding EF-hand superfamily protein
VRRIQMRVWSKVLMLLVACLVAVSLGLGGEEKKERKKGERGKMSIEQIFNRLDTDKDGFISKDEYLASRGAKADPEKAKARFEEMDTNKDGKLSKDEFSAAMKKMMEQRKEGKKEGEKAKPKFDPEDLFKRLDTNNDGKLSLDEWKAGPMGKRVGEEKAKARFDQMDTNKDGSVSLEEFKAAMKMGRGGKRGERNPPKKD